MKEFDYSNENIKRTVAADYFNRNIYIKNLINYINNADEQSTYAISGEWGSGKTVFMHQLMYVINNREILGDLKFAETAYDEDGKKDIEVFYYNAWESELLKQPSIAILNSIIDEYCLFNTDDRILASETCRKLANIAIKLGTAGFLNLSDFESDKKDELNIESIKKTLKETIDLIIEQKNCKKVVVIVDELDRCKPTTVVSMFEEVKHFYEHDSLCFIFSADFRQLGYTIKKMYGESFDSDLYMQRFFDAFFTLNSNEYEKYINEELLYDIGEIHIAHEICKVAISYNALSIRETNKFIKKYKAIEKEIFSNDHFNPEVNLVRYVFVPWGMALKYKNSDEYRSFMSGQLKEEEIIKFLGTSKDLANWVRDCCYQNQRMQAEENIGKKLFEVYKRFFRQSGFKYFGEKQSDDYLRRKILSYIEF